MQHFSYHRVLCVCVVERFHLVGFRLVPVWGWWIPKQNKKEFRRWNHESSGDDDATYCQVRTGIIIFALEVKLKTTTVCHSILVYF